MNSIAVITSIIILGFISMTFLVRKWLRELAEKQKPSDEMLNLLKITHQRMDEQGKSFNERLDKAAHYIAKVQKNIGEMSEIGRGMKELQEFLRSPKLRGNIGEQVLRELLQQMLPKQQFHLQYTFSSGATVDAAIRTANGIIPIDSKFPLENFRKLSTAKDGHMQIKARKDFINDVRKHIRDIAKKYILTEEGTIDYALMYIPSEAVYYEIVNEPELFEYAASHAVMPVSPTTFYAYIKAILMSFEGQKIEQQAKLILASLKALQKDYAIIENNLSILQRHLNNAYHMMTTVSGGFAQLGQRLKTTQIFGNQQNLRLKGKVS